VLLRRWLLATAATAAATAKLRRLSPHLHSRVFPRPASAPPHLFAVLSLLLLLLLLLRRDLVPVGSVRVSVEISVAKVFVGFGFGPILGLIEACLHPMFLDFNVELLPFRKDVKARLFAIVGRVRSDQL